MVLDRQMILKITSRAVAILSPFFLYSLQRVRQFQRSNLISFPNQKHKHSILCRRFCSVLWKDLVLELNYSFFLQTGSALGASLNSHALG